ncbi:hypothetical protein COT77_01130 [Candidatus Berkelbacteria bacterium CG10_big_fil_rev_8_21_14_0_10_41_12]|uniref:Uncharacterized protein n=1 Tax=Candidatus Berkelbacteria bacterium CG10_big_fil_rev_8_21_14_0_10_41_12 TaxID=1974513 RepID=A0A2M6WXF4_9BACT|nr:MAG: hypothetical protein COT77_01130 [Candidatus Berkelbacteria bacterium CG10_big_fil_rev_8_21_14_0_10_41_12]
MKFSKLAFKNYFLGFQPIFFEGWRKFSFYRLAWSSTLQASTTSLLTDCFIIKDRFLLHSKTAILSRKFSFY